MDELPLDFGNLYEPFILLKKCNQVLKGANIVKSVSAKEKRPK
jgi:hypothetical protein